REPTNRMRRLTWTLNSHHRPAARALFDLTHASEPCADLDEALQQGAADGPFLDSPHQPPLSGVEALSRARIGEALSDNRID
ncbi:MAG: hypothetical protein AB1449_04140, partial [Chloroflexota bacterium]